MNYINLAFSISDGCSKQWQLDNAYHMNSGSCKQANISQDGSLLAVLFDEV